MSISISIVEDDRKTREMLVKLFASNSEIRCLNAYSNGEMALRGIVAQPPDVVLVDIQLPGMSGIECVGRLALKLPSLRMLMLTTYEDRELIFDSLRAGASGYLLKNSPHAELVLAIEQIHAGGAPMSMPIARKVIQHFRAGANTVNELSSLTPREQELLAMLAKGYPYKEIASRMNIGMGTVQSHVKHIYDKLHVQSRTEAAAKFFGRANEN